MANPLLLNYSVPRTHGKMTPGYYSPKSNMWVIVNDGKEVPLIELDKNLAELTTKTDQISESDDQKYSSVIEITTKTMTVQEQDDQHNYTVGLELTTKTEAESEHDDTSASISNLFL